MYSDRLFIFNYLNPQILYPPLWSASIRYEYLACVDCRFHYQNIYVVIFCNHNVMVSLLHAWCSAIKNPVSFLSQLSAFIAAVGWYSENWHMSGSVAQLFEHRVCKPGVGVWSPLWPQQVQMINCWYHSPRLVPTSGSVYSYAWFMQFTHLF